eukprot:8082521-Lingulodinium_polyedra.AAC.1
METCKASPGAKSAREVRRLRFMSARAIVMEHCPELFPPAKGKLWWEKRGKRRQKLSRAAKTA